MIQNESNSIESSLILYSVLHHLLLSLLRPNSPAVSAVITYLTDSLIPAIDAISPPLTAEGAASDEDDTLPRRKIQDALLDVIWQLEQEVENGLLSYLLPTSVVASATGKIEEDESIRAEQDAARLAAAETANIAAGRATVVALLKGLNVSARIRACASRAGTNSYHASSRTFFPLPCAWNGVQSVYSTLLEY